MRHRCRAAPASTDRAASTSPGWASEITSCTPWRPRAARPRRSSSSRRRPRISQARRPAPSAGPPGSSRRRPCSRRPPSPSRRRGSAPPGRPATRRGRGPPGGGPGSLHRLVEAAGDLGHLALGDPLASPARHSASASAPISSATARSSIARGRSGHSVASCLRSQVRASILGSTIVVSFLMSVLADAMRRTAVVALIGPGSFGPAAGSRSASRGAASPGGLTGWAVVHHEGGRYCTPHCAPAATWIVSSSLQRMRQAPSRWGRPEPRREAAPGAARADQPPQP